MKEDGRLRRNPFTLIAVLGAFYAYYAIREMGHLISALALGLEFSTTLRFRILPGFDVLPVAAEITPKEAAVVILSGPVMALIAGYALLAVFVHMGNVVWAGTHTSQAGGAFA